MTTSFTETPTGSRNPAVTVPLLEVKGVSKRFPGVQALSSVSFAVRPGTVHALLGENGAGKSTLTKVLIGWHTKDEGEILVRGEPMHFRNPKQALRAGISIIQQELSPIHDMSIAENIFLGREPRLGPFVDYARLNQMAREVLSPLGLSLDPGRRLGSLSLAEVQLVEIAKALSHDADVVIMDEPTSALGDREVARLLAIIGLLKGQGKGVIYISHKLEEIFEIADEITVLRDGRQVDTVAAAGVTREALIRMMIGKDVQDFPKEGSGQRKALLEVRGLTRRGEFSGIDLTLHKGEILGVFGLMGAGKSEFLHALFGVTKAEAGEVVLDGQRVRFATPASARRQGLALITEDRKKSGLMLAMSVEDNITLASLARLCPTGLLAEGVLTKRVADLVKTLDIRMASLAQPVGYLSGGNQQKAILARWLMTDPRILLLDEPTRGIDVGAKREIYRFMAEFVAAGRGIIMVSSELPEVLGMSDRIAVFRRGQLAGVLPRNRCSKEALMDLAV